MELENFTKEKLLRRANFLGIKTDGLPKKELILAIKKREQNPYAFALNGGGDIPDQNGLTLLDFFASKAISGFTSATDPAGEWTSRGCASEIAEQAYSIAKAMIEERQKHL